MLPGLQQVYAVRRRLLKSWSVIRERDYIENPKADGYRAVHLVASRKGFPIEVQLRTSGQDIWANTVEESGREFGMDFKFGAGDERTRKLFAEMAELIAAWDRREVSGQNLRVGLGYLPGLTMENRQERDSNEPQ